MKINYKSVIVPSKGRQICSVDLVSAEMITLALLAECPSMLNALETGEDLHIKVACVAFGKAPEDVTKSERQMAKVINYLTNYGGSAWILRESIIKQVGLEISEEKCEEIMEARFAVWPEIPAWWDSVFKQLEDNVYLVNLLGRSKPFLEMRWVEQKGAYIRNASLEKNARAWLNQSTVADVTKLAMCRLIEEEKKHKGLFSFLLEVHDSLVVEYETGHEAEISAIMDHCFNIPINAGWREYVIPISKEFGPDYGRTKPLAG